MKSINACLMFDGTCAEAMKFYQKSLKGDLQIKLYNEVLGDQTPPSLYGRIMNARLTKGNATLLGADIMPSPDFKFGNNFTVSISCDSKQEVDQLMLSLSKGGAVTMPGVEMPWAPYFGMLRDKYGIDWMFSVENSK